MQTAVEGEREQLVGQSGMLAKALFLQQLWAFDT